MLAEMLPWLLLGLVLTGLLGVVLWIFFGGRDRDPDPASSGRPADPLERRGVPASAPQPMPAQPPYLAAPTTAPPAAYHHPPPAYRADSAAMNRPAQDRALALPESRDSTLPNRDSTLPNMNAPQQTHPAHQMHPPPPLPRRHALTTGFTPAPRRPAAVIEGQVRGASGTGIAGASLTLIDLAGGQIGRGVTSQDGSYNLSVPSAGNYFLIARARAHHPQASTVTVADQPVRLAIVLTGLSELAGVVRVAGSDETVPSALVTLLDLRGEVIDSVTTDAHGRYHFAELVGGSYTLAASASPFRPAARVVTVADTGGTMQDIELSAGAYLRGVIMAGREPRPVNDARVALLDAEGNVVGMVRTDASGEYMFHDVPEGHYTLQASGYPAVETSLQVLSGRKHEQDVELRHPDD